MPLTRVQFKPGINQELTIYANEGGWISCDKTRFRNGYPEQLGGWTNYSPGNTFVGTARAMYNWIDFNGDNLLGLGTNQKYYIELGGQYNDITPIANYQTNYLGVATATNLAASPFSTVNGSLLVTVTDATFNSTVGTWVTFSNMAPFNNVNLNGAFEIVTSLTSATYQIIAPTVASGTGAGGGSFVTALYTINGGPATQSSGTGWGIGPWGMGGWGTSTPVSIPIQLWSQVNFNQDLIMNTRGGAIYYWVNSAGTWKPAITLNQYANGQVKTTQPFSWVGGPTTTITTSGNTISIDPGAYVSGAGIVPGTYVTFVGGITVVLSQNTSTATGTNVNLTFSYAGQTAPNEASQIITSSTYGFVVALGSTPYSPTNFSPQFSPMLVRWSDQSNAAEWTPTTSNQSGQSLLTNGSYIIGSVNTRQEILIWTDQSLYSMQYIGPPYVWGFTSLMDNITAISPNCMVTINGLTYWMGTDKFYVYSGMVNVLPCTLRKYIFNNINFAQSYQVVCGYNESFNEVWWLYPSINSQVNDSYVIYNYLENLWYYGTLNRTFWYQNFLRNYPMAAYSQQNSYLSAALGSTDTSLTLINGNSYPTSGTIRIDSEQLTYTGVSNSTLTNLVRGVNGTTAASHMAYTAVINVVPNQVLYHEFGVDDLSWPLSYGPRALNSFIQSADFDIADGHHYGFVWRALPDFEFTGSTALSPTIFLTVYPRQDAGSAYSTNVDTPTVTSSSTSPINLFTGQIYTRVRGRQMAFRISSPNQGVWWQMGAMRFDIRPDGRR